MKRTILIIAMIAMFSLFIAGCESVDPDSLITPTITPTASATATSTPTTATTNTPTPTPEPAFDINAVSDGGANAMAVWDGDTLTSPAAVEAGAMIYCNNLEQSQNNRFPTANSYAEAVVELSDEKASTGSNSVYVSKRKKNTHGLSGTGIMLDATNGFDYASLVGHTITVKCFIYYAEEAFEVASEVDFALYDCYRTEVAPGYTYDRNNDLIKDEDGNPVLKDQDDVVFVSSCPVQIDTWTECSFTLTVQEATVEDGILLIGTKDEVPNTVGMFTSYYIDDITISVVE